jgi:transcriptional regulator with XRE-family HTH domain
LALSQYTHQTMTARERLRAWIKNHTNQRRFAQELAIDEGYLSQVLSGRRTPRLPILADIERQTGIPVGSWVPTGRGETAKQRRNRRESRKLGAGKSHAA